MNTKFALICLTSAVLIFIVIMKLSVGEVPNHVTEFGKHLDYNFWFLKLYASVLLVHEFFGCTEKSKHTRRLCIHSYKMDNWYKSFHPDFSFSVHQFVVIFTEGTTFCEVPHLAFTCEILRKNRLTNEFPISYPERYMTQSTITEELDTV